jgi:Zn-dependent protease with chaperone function
MGAHRFRLPVTVAAAAVAAGAATLLLRPRGGLIEPAGVSPQAYFSPAELDRARDFNDPQRLLGIGTLVIEGGILLLLATRPPRAVRRALERVARRPVLGGAAAGAGIAVVLAVAALPTGAVAHQRAVDVGLSTQGWGGWLTDDAKSTAIGAVFAAGGAALALGLVRRFPRAWWAPASVCVVALSGVFVFLSPVLLDPLFNRFTPVPAGELRSEVLDLADRAGVKVGEVYRVDASRRTTGANAYVGGLGSTKRVVLYDNLVERFSDDQVRSVVAHELGHVRHRDVLRGLAWLALVAPAATLLVQRLTEALVRRRPGAGALGTPAMLPALLISLTAVSFAAGVAGNVLSRRVEARADAFALDLTRNPAAFIALERSLAISNVSDPDPPGWARVLFGTHPDAMERIGAGLAWARRH